MEPAGRADLAGSAKIDPRNDSHDFNHGNVLARRARRSGRIDVDRDFGAFSLGAGVYAASARYDDPANSVRMGGYSLVDLRAAYAIDRDWSVQASVANVGDRDYETAAFYRQPGRSYTLTVRYRPAE